MEGSSNAESSGPWRVEWHAGDRIEVVARLALAFPHHSTLEPWVGRLRDEGRDFGTLVLVDEVSDIEVARRRLDRPLTRRTRPPAPRVRCRPTRSSGPEALEDAPN